MFFNKCNYTLAKTPVYYTNRVVKNKTLKIKNKSFLKLIQKKAFFIKHYDYNLNYKSIMINYNIKKRMDLTKLNKRGCFLKKQNKKFAIIKNTFNASLTKLIIVVKKNTFKLIKSKLNHYYGFLWKKDKKKAQQIIKIAKLKNTNWYKKKPYYYFFYGDTDDIYIKNNICFKNRNNSIPGLLKKKERKNLFYKKKVYSQFIQYKKKILCFTKGL